MASSARKLHKSESVGEEHFLLDERSQSVLKSIVSEYIKQGDPVGSRTLSKVSGLNLSPASFRNVMSDLEEMGLLSNLHTSSGRVPTARGLRFYINSLAAFRPPPRNVVNALKQGLNIETSTALFDSANKIVSQITSFASLIAVPSASSPKIKRIQFLKLSDRRLLLVVVTSDGNVTNSVLTPSEDYTASELEETANYFNRHLRDKTFSEASNILLKQMRRLYRKIRKSIALLQESLEQIRSKHEEEGDIFITGTEKLLRYQEEAEEMDKLRDLLNTLEKRKAFRKLLDSCSKAPEVQIFIGNESGFPLFGELSIVSLGLTDQEEPLGMIGVIGPKWMKYEQVVPLVRVTAQVVGDSLRKIRSEYE